MMNSRSEGPLLAPPLAWNDEVRCLESAQGANTVQDGAALLVLVVLWSLLSLPPFPQQIVRESEDDGRPAGADKGIIVEILLHIGGLNVKVTREDDANPTLINLVRSTLRQQASTLFCKGEVRVGGSRGWTGRLGAVPQNRI